MKFLIQSLIFFFKHTLNEYHVLCLVLPDEFQKGLITELRHPRGRKELSLTSLTSSKSFRSRDPYVFLESSAHYPVQAASLDGSKVQYLKQFEKKHKEVIFKWQRDVSFKN